MSQSYYYPSSGGGGSGTVTSVGIAVPSFLSVSGSPITSSGTITIGLSGTPLPIANGGTGQTTANTAFNALAPSQTGNSGKVLTTDGTNSSWMTVSGTGSVTSVSVVSANGFAGTVATATTTPAITLSTTISGVLKGNGTAISQAVVGTDYSMGTSGLTTGILKSTTTTGALTIAIAADFPTLNQNTTGSAASFTGPLVGDVIGTQGATVIDVNTVTNAKLAQMPTNTIKGNNTGGTANALDLTTTQVNTMLGTSGSATSIGALDAQAANATGLALVSQVLSTQSADATHPGMVNNTTQSFSGNKTFTGTIGASNLAGTNTGDVTLTAVGASPSANAATLSGQALTLQPFDSTHPGVVPASGGGTTNFLRADGTFATPASSAPVFRGMKAHLSANVATTGQINIVFDTVDYDTASSYDNTTGFYTISATGYWMITASVRILNTGTSTPFYCFPGVRTSGNVQLGLLPGIAAKAVVPIDIEINTGGAVVLHLTVGDVIVVYEESNSTYTMLGTVNGSDSHMEISFLGT